jgi:hypothetical protein
MSHGHDHGGGAGHGDAHGHGAAPAPAHYGPAEIPPAPAQRSITPAPEDFEHLPGPTALAWPLLWMGLAGFLAASFLCGGWPAFHDEHAAPEHGAEHHR